jgi:hypothetical protein
MLPQDLSIVAGTSGNENMIKNEHIPNIHRIMQNLPIPALSPDQADRLYRRVDEPFFTVHNHPGGWPSPSRGDLWFQHLYPGQPDHLLGVVSHSGTSGLESSLNPLDPRGSTVVVASNHDPADSLFQDRTLPYLNKYSGEGHYEHAARDPYTRDLVRSLMPYGTESEDVDKAARDLLRRFGYLPPLLRLSEPDRGVYDILYDVGNVMTPLSHTVDQNDALEQLYQQMKKRGHLDYCEGGLV